MSILMQILKPLLEVIVNEILKIFTAPDQVLPDPSPTLDAISSAPPDLSGYLGLLEGKN